MKILLKFGHFDFVVINFLKALIVDFFELIKIKDQVCILFHFPLAIKFLGFQDFLIPNGRLYERLFNMDKMAINLLRSGILGLFFHVLKVIFFNISLVEFD